jgi:hypothetical protein
MKRITRLLLSCAALLAAAGCANSGTDVWSRAREHIEWHALGYNETFEELHHYFDRHILSNATIRDPDSY